MRLINHRSFTSRCMARLFTGIIQKRHFLVIILLGLSQQLWFETSEQHTFDFKQQNTIVNLPTILSDLLLNSAYVRELVALLLSQLAQACRTSLYLILLKRSLIKFDDSPKYYPITAPKDSMFGLNSISLGQAYNDMLFTLTDRRERHFLVSQALLLTGLHLALRFQTLTIGGNDASYGFLYQLIQFSHVFDLLISNSFLILASCNDAFPLVLNIIWNVVLDFSLVKSSQVCDEQINIPIYGFTSLNMIPIMGSTLLLMIADNQVQRQVDQKTQKFNEFLVNDLKTVKSSQIKVAVSLAKSQREQEQGSKVAYSSLTKLQCPERATGLYRAISDTSLDLELRVLHNASNIQVKHSQSFMSSELTVNLFCMMLRINNMNEMRAFIAMNLNFSTLRNTPDFKIETPSGQANSQKIETDRETFNVSYNRDFNVMTLDVISKKVVGFSEGENQSVVKRAVPVKIERAQQVVNKDSYSSIVTFAAGRELQAIAKEECDSNLANKGESQSVSAKQSCQSQPSFADLVEEQVQNKDSKVDQNKSVSAKHTRDSCEIEPPQNKMDKCSVQSEKNGSSRGIDSSTEQVVKRLDTQSVLENPKFLSCTSESSLFSAGRDNSLSLSQKISSAKKSSNMRLKTQNQFKQPDSKSDGNWLKKKLSLKSYSDKSQNELKQLKNFQFRQMIVNELEAIPQKERRHKQKGRSNSIPEAQHDPVYQELMMSKMQHIQKKLKNNRIFMDMVIHDMRNPTNAISFGISETILMLNNEYSKIQSIKKQMALTIELESCYPGNRGNQFKIYQDLIMQNIRMSHEPSVGRISSQFFRIKNLSRAVSYGYHLPSRLLSFIQKVALEAQQNYQVLLDSQMQRRLRIQDIEESQQIEEQKQREPDSPRVSESNLPFIQSYSVSSEQQIMQQLGNSHQSMPPQPVEEQKEQSHSEQSIQQVSRAEQIREQQLDDALIEIECDIPADQCDEQEHQIILDVNHPKIFKANDNTIAKKDQQQLSSSIDQIMGRLLIKFQQLDQNIDQQELNSQFQLIQSILQQSKELLNKIRGQKKEHIIELAPQPKPVMVSKECQYEVPGAQRVEMPYLRRVRDSQEIYRLSASDQNQRHISEEALRNNQILENQLNQQNSAQLDIDENHKQIQGTVTIHQEIQGNLGSLPQISQSHNAQRHIDSQGQSQFQFMLVLKKLEDENKILKETTENFKRRLQVLINEQTESNKLIEMYEDSLLKIEKQDFFEKHFFEKVEKTLKNTEFSAKMLSNLINDMLDLAKYDAGTFKFYNEFFDLSEVIQNAFETVRFQSDKRGITLDFEVVDERTKKQSLREQAHSEQERKSNEWFIPQNKHQQSHQSCEEIASQSNISNIGQSRKSSDFQSNFSPKSWSESTNIQDPKLFFCELYGDKNRYTQIVLNFLSNAIHYSKKNGKIIIRLVVMEDQQIKSRPSIVNCHKLEESSSSLMRERVHTKTEGNKGRATMISIKKPINDNARISSLEFQPLQDELNSLIVDDQNKSYKKLSQEHVDNELKFITFRIEIEDNGVGIKKENLKSLFQDFNRLDTNLNKKGTGLGLSICKNLIEKMGGRVDVESEFGKGSNFKIQLSTKTNPHFASLKKRECQKQKESDNNADCDLENESMFAQQALLHSDENQASNKSQQIDSQSQIINSRTHNSVGLNNNIQKFQSLYTTNNLNLQNNSLKKPQINNNKLIQTCINNRQEVGSTMNNQLQFQQKLLQMQIQRSECNVRQLENSNSNQLNRIKNKAQNAIAQPIQEIKYQEPQNDKQFSSDSIENSYFSQDNKSPCTKNSSDEFKKKSLSQLTFGNNSQNEQKSSNEHPSFLMEGVLQPEVKFNQSQISEESKEESKQCNDPEKPELQGSEFRCLLANDCDLQLMVMRLNLERCGVTVVDVINGQEALEQVIESTSKFDFIVLDLKMPIMDGFESAKRIIAHCKGENMIFQDNSCNSFNRDWVHDQSIEEDKSLDIKSQHILDIYEEMSQVPFLVACSAHVNDEVTKQCLDIGFNAIIESPMTVQKIESDILKHLRNDRLQRQILEDKIQRRQSQQKSIQDRMIQIQEGSVLSGGKMQISSNNSGAFEQVDELNDQKDEESVSACSEKQ